MAAATAANINVGDEVSWKHGKGKASGVVHEIKTSGTLEIETGGKKVHKNASEEDPAVHIECEGDKNDVVKRASELTLKRSASESSDEATATKGSGSKAHTKTAGEEIRDDDLVDDEEVEGVNYDKADEDKTTGEKAEETKLKQEKKAEKKGEKKGDAHDSKHHAMEAKAADEKADAHHKADHNADYKTDAQKKADHAKEAHHDKTDAHHADHHADGDHQTDAQHAHDNQKKLDDARRRAQEAKRDAAAKLGHDTFDKDTDMTEATTSQVDGDKPHDLLDAEDTKTAAGTKRAAAEAADPDLVDGIDTPVAEEELEKDAGKEVKKAKIDEEHAKKSPTKSATKKADSAKKGAKA